MKCNYRNLSTSDLKAMLGKRIREVREIGDELLRRGIPLKEYNEAFNSTDITK